MKPAPVSPTGVSTGMEELVGAGLAFLGQLEKSLQAPVSPAPGKPSGLAGFIRENRDTGQPELQIPLPDPDTAAKLGDLLGGVAGLLQQLGKQR